MKKLKMNLRKLKQQKKIVNIEKLVYKTNKYTCSFKIFQIIRSVTKNIFNSKITLNEADKDPISLLFEILDFQTKIKPKKPSEKITDKRYY